MKQRKFPTNLLWKVKPRTRGSAIWAIVGVPTVAVLALAITTFTLGSKPAKRLRVKMGPIHADCGCSGAQASRVGDFQVLNLNAGDSWNVDWSQASGIAAGGTWYSNSGSMTQSGVYSVPTAAQPDGLDVLTYLDPAGVDHTFVVYINPTAFTQQAITVPSNYFERAEAPTPISSAQSARFIADEVATATTSSAPAIPDDGQWHEVTDGADQPPASAVPVGCVVASLLAPDLSPTKTIPLRPGLQTTSTFGVTRAQTSDPTLTSLVLTGPVTNSRPTVCTKHHPLYGGPPYLGQPCNGGTRLVLGPLKKYSKRDPWMSAGSVTVNAGMSATIESIFSIKVSAGAVVNCKIKNIEWTKIQNEDIYTCSNGVWTYSGSKSCVSTGEGAITDPVWWDYFEGYPSDGSPASWSPAVCNPL